MSEKSNYRLWNTPSGSLPPVLIRYGEQPWQTEVKVGDEWLPISDVNVHFQSDKLPYAELKLYGHFRFEYVGEPK